MHQLLSTLVVFFTLLACPPIVEKLFTGIVSGRGLFVGMVFVGAFTCWRCHRARQIRIRSRRDELRWFLQADPKIYFPKKDQQGEANWQFIFWMAAAVFGLLYLGASLSLAAEPVHIDQILTEATEQLFPAVPLSAQELADLQRVALNVAVIAKGLQTNPSEMTNATRERRLQMRRELEKLHSVLVDIMVQHAGAVIIATRKGGAR